MKIGLVRHFKVDITDKGSEEKLIDSNTYNQMMRKYDEYGVIKSPVDLRDIDWNKGYSSDLSRAITTAKTIYKGDIKKDSLIREVDLRFNQDIDGLHTITEWSSYSMISWAQNDKRMIETIDNSAIRINKFLDKIEKENNINDNILIVCHGLIMTVLDKELKKRGFQGETAVTAENGQLFLYNKEV